MTKPEIIYRKLPTGIEKITYEKKSEDIPVNEESDDHASPDYNHARYNLYKKKNDYIQYDINRDDENLSDCID